MSRQAPDVAVHVHVAMSRCIDAEKRLMDLKANDERVEVVVQEWLAACDSLFTARELARRHYRGQR